MVAEGASLDIPPRLNDPEELINFILWKKRFEVFVKAKSLRLWEIIEFGDYIPQKVTPDGNGEIVKPKGELSEEDTIKVRENHIVMHMLYCALHDRTLELVVTCDTAHDVWETLAVIFEGNSQLKDEKFCLLTLEFEAFKKLKGENIDQMYARFNRIIISLKALGRAHTNKRNVKKFLSALPYKWDMLVAVISENQDTFACSLEDVIGRLKVRKIEKFRKKQLQLMRGM